MVIELKIAFQGEHGAYSEMASLQHFGSNIELMPFKTLFEVFGTVENRKANYAVVPIENSIEGSVNETYDLLINTRMTVCNEIYFHVVHCLISYKESDLSKIRTVYSHPQALAQCRSFLRKHMMEPIPFFDTAGSVKMLKEFPKDNTGAIASQRAAETYELEVIEKGIEDNKNNYTRFIVLSDGDSEPTGNDKTLAIFTIKHLPGALYKVIGEFSSMDINLTMIVSRPTKGTPWEYNFFVDFEGHRNDSKIKECLERLRNNTEFFKVLGSYPRFKQ